MACNERCPTCGSAVVVVGGDEGTNHYVSAPSESDGRFIAIEKYDAVVAEAERLRAAIEDYALWRPGEKGHAAAHRKLMEALR